LSKITSTLYEAHQVLQERLTGEAYYGALAKYFQVFFIYTEI